MEKKYKVGMYGGKFFPLHKGHVYCIQKACELCEKVYVLLFINSESELNAAKTAPKMKELTPEYRINALKKVVNSIPNAEMKVIDTLHCKNSDGTEDWSKERPLVIEACGKFDAVFGSEPSYADYFAKAYPYADYVILDTDRKSVPISATMIRNMDEKERQNWMI